MTASITRRSFLLGGTMSTATLLAACGGAPPESAAETSEAAFALDPTSAIEVTGGQITGDYANDDKTVAVYKGIPYAAAPVGDLRWKVPQDVEPWSDVRACTEWGASAIQPEQAPFMMWTKEFIIEDTGYSEDCLSLNVWAGVDGEADKPVIVFIHGGANTSGGSSCDVYNGTFMAESGAVFVNINYRVGLLGFLAHPELSAESDEGVSGNYALADQIKALEWVRDNIATFGGDPANVTIMGQSAGSCNVQTLMMSPKAAGLFTNALAESYNVVDTQFTPLSDAETTGQALFEGKTLEEMRALSAAEVLAIQTESEGAPSAHVIDGVFLTEDYADAAKGGTLNDCSFMTGYVTGDTMLFSAFNEVATADDFERVAGETFGDNAAEFLTLYPVESDEDAVAQAQAYGVDSMGALIHANADLRAAGGEPATYSYYFTHVMPGPDAEAHGAFHTADVPYFLGILDDERADYWGEDDRTVADTMSAYLLNFARTGDPNGDGLVEWKPDTEANSLVLDAACEETALSAEKLAFYKKVYAALYE